MSGSRAAIAIYVEAGFGDVGGEKDEKEREKGWQLEVPAPTGLKLKREQPTGQPRMIKHQGRRVLCLIVKSFQAPRALTALTALTGPFGSDKLKPCPWRWDVEFHNRVRNSANSGSAKRPLSCIRRQQGGAGQDVTETGADLFVRYCVTVQSSHVWSRRVWWGGGEAWRGWEVRGERLAANSRQLSLLVSDEAGEKRPTRHVRERKLQGT